VVIENEIINDHIQDRTIEGDRGSGSTGGCPAILKRSWEIVTIHVKAVGRWFKNSILSKELLAGPV